MTDPVTEVTPYTEADIELVAAAIRTEKIVHAHDGEAAVVSCSSEVIAEQALKALAMAGRLLPEDTRIDGYQTEWGVRWPDQPAGYAAGGFLSAESARAYATDKTVTPPGDVVKRVVLVGEWVPVPEPSQEVIE